MCSNDILIHAAASPRFQKILAEDPVIAELEARRYDSRTELLCLMDVFGAERELEQLKLGFITPALWAYLHAAGNRYTTRPADAEEEDADLFLYLLTREPCELLRPLLENEAAALHFCRKNGLDFPQVHAKLSAMTERAFHALEMLPESRTAQQGEKQFFDADWLTHLCSVVAQETNETIRDVMFRMSLCVCCYCLIQHLRKHDPKHRIRRRTASELCRQIYLRTMQLAQEFHSA